jgi:MoxR-like ATPase
MVEPFCDFDLMEMNKSIISQRTNAIESVLINGNGMQLDVSSSQDRPARIPVNAVMTKSTTTNIEQLHFAVSTRRPVLVHGEYGSGKSFLIREVAETFGAAQTILEIHVDSQTDSKSLIGTYICSDIPGEFIWKNGVIAQAALHGNWVVIENLDQVPVDVIASLLSLFESRTLFLPDRGSMVEAHPNFRILASSSSTAIRKATRENSLFANIAYIPQHGDYSYLWHAVFITAPDVYDVRDIIISQFPSLLGEVIDKLLRIYQLFNRKAAAEDVTLDAAQLQSVTSSTRCTNCRDLLKVCRRISMISASTFNQTSKLLTSAQRKLCLVECVDIFAASIREYNVYCNFAHQLGHYWDVTKDEVDSCILKASPQINRYSDSVLGIGRLQLAQVLSSNPSSNDLKRDYAYTSYSARIIERLAVCVAANEAVLLVGETGTGKTSSIQELAVLMNKRLLVQNLSISTDSDDLFGGHRPVNIKQLLNPVFVDFIELFQRTFSSSSNTEFLQIATHSFRNEQWKKLIKIFQKGVVTATQKLSTMNESASKSTNATASTIISRWNEFSKRVNRLEVSLPRLEKGFAYSFVNGMIIDAMKNGDWILLDEVNLASSEALDSLAGILEGQSFLFTGAGDLESIPRHPEFRLFAAMNPPTDVGKRELPSLLRTRFTEFYVEELFDPRDLQAIVKRYLPEFSDNLVEQIVSTYAGCRHYADATLTDISGRRIHYSLRSLTRSLLSARKFISIGMKSPSRAIFEGFVLNFYTKIGDPDQKSMLWQYLLSMFGLTENNLSSALSRPTDKSADWVSVKPFWLRAGKRAQVDWTSKDAAGIVRFVTTKSTEVYLRHIITAIATNVAPILLEGPTSVGKTTMIEYLAARTGNYCIRINNHEHTDIQEYVGGYVSGRDGQLVFQEGSLVRALRNGYWIILDELNLAPSDVLEALNRLLDDNRELLIPETGDIVKPSPGFQLFATQNPSGLYGGRKPLSRAFRNRFIEIVVDEFPRAELEDIVSASCGMPKKFAKMMVDTMMELQTRRQQSTVFEGKSGAVTLRDLVKWGKRSPSTPFELCRTGYMVLGEKLRASEEKQVVLEVLTRVCREAIDLSSMYTDADGLQEIQHQLRTGSLHAEGMAGIAITKSMCRLWTLVRSALTANEPVLIVGGTSLGKTSVCQLYAASTKQPITILSCHQSIEASDLIGCLRPIRDRSKISQNIESLMKDATRILQDVKLVSDLDVEKLSKALCSLEYIAQESSAPGSIAIKESIDSLIVLADQLSMDESGALDEAKDRLDYVHENAIDVSSPSGDSHRSIAQSLLAIVTKLKLLLARYTALFEWQDGPLVTAMRQGHVFVLDEINLADDAVIERLNSILESNRVLTLVEKPLENDVLSADSSKAAASETIVAHPDFKFLATMNPGGDFGKRELSPALRSRFTEIWVPDISLDDGVDDFKLIAMESVNLSLLNLNANTNNHLRQSVVDIMIKFMLHFNIIVASQGWQQSRPTIRDLVAWCKFIECSGGMDEFSVFQSLFHGAHMLFLDGLGVSTTNQKTLIADMRSTLTEKLLELIPEESKLKIVQLSQLMQDPPVITADEFQLQGFSIPLGSHPIEASFYSISSQNTRLNLQRILRASQVHRPILLEGAPGVGKTSIVVTLAKLSGNRLFRFNLSEQTEISDLIGTDLPTCDEDDNSSLKYKWKDGLFLQAMKAGDWILLDELNLAPQSVLEGLNSCFDHRQEILIPEIDQVVHVHPSFRIFCAQNPHASGGGRKGLPRSFLSRLSRVFVESISTADMTSIAVSYNEQWSSSSQRVTDVVGSFVSALISLLTSLQYATSNSSFGITGSPWDLNLRDVLRWIDFMHSCFASTKRAQAIEEHHDFMLIANRFACKATSCVIQARFRSEEDKIKVAEWFHKEFGFPLVVDFSDDSYFLDGCLQGRSASCAMGDASINVDLFHSCMDYHLPHISGMNAALSISFAYSNKSLEYLLHCISATWPLLLVGGSGTGKRRCIRILANYSGNHLVEYYASVSTDISDLIGSYEQRSFTRKISSIVQTAESFVLVALNFAIVSFNSLSNQRRQLVYDMLKDFHEVKQGFSSTSGSETHSPTIFICFLQQLSAVVSSVKFCLDDEYFLPLSKEIKSCSQQISATIALLSSNALEAGSFEWIDGIVVQAAKRGDWLLINNVNLCQGSVLDRLNSLLESNGSLLLSENGSGEVIKPHPSFRIILAMNPTWGEISRAMRNRCVEIFFPRESNLSTLYLQAEGSNESSSSYVIDDYQVAKSLISEHALPNFPIRNSLLLLRDAKAMQLGLYERNILSELTYHLFYVNPRVAVNLVLYRILSKAMQLQPSMVLANIQHCIIEAISALKNISMAKITEVLDIIHGYDWSSLSSLHSILSAIVRTLCALCLCYKISRYEEMNFSNIINDMNLCTEYVTAKDAISSPDILIADMAHQIRSFQDLKCLFRFASVAVFSRLNIIMQEEQCNQLLVDLKSRMSNQTCPNAWVFAKALLEGSTLSSSKEEDILISIFRYLQSIDSIAKALTQMFRQTFVMDQKQLRSDCLDMLTRVLRYRDVISRLLQRVSHPYTSIPWEALSVIIRWLYKLFRDLKSVLWQSSATKDFEIIVQKGLSDLSNVSSAISKYWNNAHFSPEKCHLWKAKGRALIPVDIKGWGLFESASEALASLDFLMSESDDSLRGYETSMHVIHQHDSIPFRLLTRVTANDSCKTALGLMATVLCTNAGFDEHSSMERFQLRDVDSLIGNMRDKVVAAASDASLRLSHLKLDIEELLKEGSFLKRLHDDKYLSLASSVAISCQHLIEDTLFQLSIALHVLNYQDFESSASERTIIAVIHDYSFSILQLSVDSSALPLQLLKDFQILAWLADAVMKKPFDQSLRSYFRRICRTISATIKASLFQVKLSTTFNDDDATAIVPTYQLFFTPRQQANKYLAPTNASDRDFVSYLIRNIDPRLLLPQSDTKPHTSIPTITMTNVHEKKQMFKYFLKQQMIMTSNNLRKEGLMKPLSSSLPTRMLHRILSIADIAVSTIFSCRDYYPAGLQSFLHGIHERLSSSYAKNLTVFGELWSFLQSHLEHINNARIRNLFSSHLLPVLKFLSKNPLHCDARSSEYAQESGYAQALAGRLYASLILPCMPIDPSTSDAVKLQIFSEDVRIEATTMLTSICEHILTGSQDLLDTVFTMSSSIAKKNSKVRKYEKLAKLRPPNAPSFAEMHAELTESLETFLHVDRLYDLCMFNAERSITKDEFDSEELHWQNSVQELFTHLSAKYYHYNDILSLFLSGLQMMSEGVSVAKSTIIQASIQTNADMLKFAYPIFVTSSRGDRHHELPFLDYAHKLFQCQDAVRLTDSDRGLSAHMSILFFMDYLLASEVHGSCSNQLMEINAKLLDTFVHMFEASEEEQKRQKELTDASFVYKTRTESWLLDDSADEEATMAKELPEHLASLDFLNVSEQVDPSADGRASVSHADVMKDNVCTAIVGHHARFNLLWHYSKLPSLLWSTHNESQGSGEESIRRRELYRRAMLQYLGVSLIDRQNSHELSPLMKENDHTLQGVSRAMLSTMLSSLSSVSSTSSRDCHCITGIDRDLDTLLDVDTIQRNPDFHKDPNVEEAMKGKVTIETFIARAVAILHVFPDNEILLQISRVAAAILGLHVSTALGKLLISCEVLLRKANEWEDVASSHYSLSNEISSLKMLIGRWRDIELNSWKSLLRCREERHCLSAMKTWYLLHKHLHLKPEKLHIFCSSAIVQDKADRSAWRTLKSLTPHWLSRSHSVDAHETSSDESELLLYIRSIVAIANSYLMESSVGEYGLRLHIIRAFAVEMMTALTTARALNSSETQWFMMLSNAIVSIWRYHAQFLPSIRLFQEKIKAPIEQKIEDEVKMGKWDRMTSYGVIEYSQKVHRKLLSILKSYEENALIITVGTIIREEFIQDVATDRPPVEKIPSQAAIFPLLKSIVDETRDNSRSLSDTTISNTFDMKLAKKSYNLEVKSTLIQRISTSDSSESHMLSRPYINEIQDLCEYCSQTVQYLFGVDEGRNDEDFHGSRYALFGSTIGESLCDQVFERIESLRSEAATKPMKLRAVADLINTTQEHGFSRQQATIPAQIRDDSSLFAASQEPFAWEVVTDLSFDCSKPHQHYLKAESYHQRNIYELVQLRQIAPLKTRKKDLSLKDESSLLHLAENMFTDIMRLRFVITAGVIDLKNYIEAKQQLFRRLQYGSKEEMLAVNGFLESLSSSILVFRCTVEEIQSLQQTSFDHLSDNESGKLVMPKPNHEHVKRVLSDCQMAVNFILDEVLPNNFRKIVLTTCQLQMKINEVLTKFKSLENCLRSESIWADVNIVVSEEAANNLIAQISNIILRCEWFNAKELRGSSDTEGLARVFGDREAEAMSRSMGVFKRVIEDLKTTTNHIESIRQSEVNLDLRSVEGYLLTPSLLLPYGDYPRLKFLIETAKLTFASTQMQSVSDAIELLDITLDESVESLHAKRLLEELLDQYERVSALLLDDLCGLYKSLSKLLYIILRLTRSLFINGICSDKIEEDADDNSSMEGDDNMDREAGEGTGLGTGSGEKDISDQIQNEDQLLGLKGDDDQETKQSNEKKKPLTEDQAKQGVEMSQEFDGEMFDIDQANEPETKDEASANDEGEDIDREMGDANNEDIIDEKEADDADHDDENEVKVKGRNNKTSVDEELMSGDENDGEDESKDNNETQDKKNKVREYDLTVTLILQLLL